MGEKMAQTQEARNVLEQVCKLAGGFSPPCGSCSFIYSTVSAPFQGGEAITFAVQDHQGLQVGVRVLRDLNESSTWRLETEWKLRKSIERQNIPLFQTALEYEPRGSTLIWTDEFPDNTFHRDRVIKASANSALDFLKINTPGTSATQFVSGKILRKIERASRGQYRGGNVAGCHVQQSMLRKFIIPAMDTAPHVLVHGDLAHHNIIVDAEFNVIKFIDLGWSDMIPLQFAAMYPRFLTAEPGDDGSFTKQTSMMTRDRAVYLDCIKTRALAEGGSTLDYFEVLSRPDENQRSWWFKATDQCDVHRAMVACNWQPDQTA